MSSPGERDPPAGRRGSPGTVDLVNASARWKELMTLPEAEVPLDEAALLIAAHGETGLDLEHQLSRLDELASRVDGGDTPGLCRLLFETLGVHGDHDTYDDPRNSYLHQVLDRRRGIPISLSVLLMELGRRCDVQLEGVGMPGHFLVRDRMEPDLLIDAFGGGRRVDRAGCARILRAVAGPRMELQSDMLAPVGTHAILSRMLANLDLSFQRRRDKAGVGWVTRLRFTLPGVTLAAQMALADGLARVGDIDAAAALLAELAERPETPPEAVQALRSRARGLLAPFN
jgi:regulator of sirC expression with transglutaminase-like and TPR domain